MVSLSCRTVTAPTHRTGVILTFLAFTELLYIPGKGLQSFEPYGTSQCVLNLATLLVALARAHTLLQYSTWSLWNRTSNENIQWASSVTRRDQVITHLSRRY